MIGEEQFSWYPNKEVKIFEEEENWREKLTREYKNQSPFKSQGKRG